MGIVTGYLAQLVNNGIKLLNGGTAVSSSNPLPIKQPPSASSGVDCAEGKVSTIRAQQVQVAGEFSRIQIENPAGNDDVILLGLAAYGGTAVNCLYSVYEISAPTGTLLVNTNTSLKIGGTPSAVKCYAAHSASAIQTTGICGGGTNSSILYPGVNLLTASGSIVIPSGKTIEIANGTANVTTNIVATVDALTK